MKPFELYCVAPGETVHLEKIDPASTPGLSGPKEQEVAAADALQTQNVQAIVALQERLWAEQRRSLLVVLQGMDTCGKDGTIRHVFGPVNPQGVRVTSFKKPTEEELAHDFLWRIHNAVPRAGCIGVFNRSHYEDVGVVRVHGLVPDAVIEARYGQINAFEHLLVAAGVRIVKFFLHISKEEQKQRLQARLDDPAKHWKFSKGDLKERARWDDYQQAYEDAITRCNTSEAPWHVIPSDRKWYRNWAVSAIVRAVLEDMAPTPPSPDFDPKAITID